MKIFDVDLDNAIDTYADVFQPVSFVNARLSRSKEESVASIIIKYWLLAAIIVFVIDALVIHFSGYDADSNKILIFVFIVLQIVSFLVSPAIYYLFSGFCACRITWKRVVIAFTPVILVQPLFHLANLPGILKRFRLVNYFVHEQFGISRSFDFMIVNGKQLDSLTTDTMRDWAACGGFISLVISVALTVVACEVIDAASRRTRFMTYLLVCLSMSLSAVPEGLLQYTQLGVAASYAPASSVLDQLRSPSLER